MLALVLSVGFGACVFVYIPSFPSQPELFTLPKEIALHATALVVAPILAMSPRRTLDVPNLIAAGYLLLGLTSVLLAGGNSSLGWRTLGITASMSLVFWSARVAGSSKLPSRILIVLTILAATISLQSYGVIPDFSLAGRSPGATIGNRNEAARMLVLAASLYWMCAMLADKTREFYLVLFYAGLATMAVTITRARTAWLGAATVAGLICLILVSARSHQMRQRTGVFAIVVVIAVILAVTLPSHLKWNSNQPYAGTLRRIMSIDQGTGKGRVIQIENTLRMAADHPVLGVGPGNWPLRYAEYASENDPSYRPETPFPTDRLAQSDWAGTLAERGFPAELLLLTGLLVLIVNGIRLTADSAESVWPNLIPPVAIAISWLIMGVGDPISQLPVGGFSIGLGLGMFTPVAVSSSAEQSLLATRRKIQSGIGLRAAVATAAVITGIALTHTLRLVESTEILSTAETIADFERAVAVDPSNYEARIAVAFRLMRNGECARAGIQLYKAAKLRPDASPERLLLQNCVRLKDSVP